MNLLLALSSLLTIYKSFVRPNLDYGDVVYDQPSNSRFSDKIETVKYNAALAITGAIRGTSKEKLYQELHFSKIPFYRLSLLNGINWILILRILIPMQCSVKSFRLL